MGESMGYPQAGFWLGHRGSTSGINLCGHTRHLEIRHGQIHKIADSAEMLNFELQTSDQGAYES